MGERLALVFPASLTAARPLAPCLAPLLLPGPYTHGSHPERLALLAHVYLLPVHLPTNPVKSRCTQIPSVRSPARVAAWLAT
ncbi:hypothetical protein IWZ03DRAFT_372668 [Phyllosticta citriasiana]|uniref:Secreted protein n=1 Tax=Phyllosticta citriasiana TaxID=595635 RepID=A0ABR1KU08_9PEZI